MSVKQDLMVIMNDTVDSIDKMIDLQNQKIEAADKEDVLMIENIMRKEEAVLMKLKGLDNKRDKLLEKSELRGKTFIDIINDDNTEFKIVMEQTYKTLKIKLDELSEKKQIAVGYIKSKINQISVLLDRIEYYNGVSYNQKGAISVESTQKFGSKRV